LLISWCSAQNYTIFSEVFEPEIRSTVYSVDRVFEGSVASLGTVIVGFIAGLLGYIAPSVAINQLPQAVAVTDTTALGQGMFIAAVIPWILCLIFYTFVYFTYTRDFERCRTCLEDRARELEKMK